VDDELVQIARASIGAEYGLSPEQSSRLTGDSARALRNDAQAMRRELGLDPVDDRPRDHGGRYAKSGGIYDKGSNAAVNSLIRQAAGRS
jgi:hypothetical protein